ncbi:methylmalonyl-CoA mutase small subunit [Bacillus sp. FJAT-49705]|uniref:Methylmalonyl-CoA mutase small subunit n=1 Tax=Cytobacillus citreus TaxID=2833586 RepID=A0ABS5NW53_9BACI|nr:methylmalonyl-CoA mutase subunit beta [Cytobacillus citreus]MBS4191164.1 methylmalonyl-CoA mutase small subunit [Cytobacillus citreus]
MTLKDMVNESFQTYSLDDWAQKAEEALKGKAVNSLKTKTFENIELKPLYTKEDLEHQKISQFPGQADFRRGNNSLGYVTEEWKIAQKIENGEEFQEKLLSALDKGQTAIAFNANKIELNDIKALAEKVYTKYPFSVEANDNQSQILSILSNLANCDKISGYIAADPLASAAIQGHAPNNEAYDNWAEAIQSADRTIPNLRTILVNTSVYHNAGGNAVQDLAIALATAVHHIQELLLRGLKLETILSKMVFKFSIGANFFMEIAKLRAARLLWSKVTEAYGAKTEDRKMVITAETSSFTKTVYDPYVNLLRAGNEAFAAVLGGIQFLHVSPFNEPEGEPTSFSDRVARNTQLILKNEAHLEKVVDPAGGSWYIESLTNELAEKAWALFLQIEEKDGIGNALKSGWLHAQIEEVLQRRNEAIFTRKQSIIGTNIYANIHDQPLKNAKNILTTVIPQIRLSEPFEKLRKTAENMEQAGLKPTVGLICLGDLKAHKARADFITGFLAPGGIHALKSENIGKPELAIQFIKEANLNHYIICGTDKQYEEAALEIVRLIKDEKRNVKVFLAGRPEKEMQEQLKQAGIDQFIHIRSNCFDILSSLLKEMEVASND